MKNVNHKIMQQQYLHPCNLSAITDYFRAYTAIFASCDASEFSVFALNAKMGIL